MQRVLVSPEQSISPTERAWYAFSDPLRAFLLKRVADSQVAEDLLQEVFLKVHTQIATLRSGEKLKPWVYQIARNVLIDFYRRKRPSVPLEEADQHYLEDENLEEDVRAKLAASVTALIRCLPARDQEALVLTEEQGLSQKELATRLGLSFSGAKSRVQRAREKLKQLLLNCCHVEFDRLGRAIDYQSRCGCCQGNQGQIPACGGSDPASNCCVFLETAASPEVELSQGNGPCSK